MPHPDDYNRDRSVTLRYGYFKSLKGVALMAGRTRRPGDPMKAAEALFKPGPKATALPAAPLQSAARESVTIRIDRDVLDHFQADGPGWQERINLTLRQAAGLVPSGQEGRRPEDLNATNDD